MIDSYLQTKGLKVPRIVEKWIRWIPLINGRFKLNLDDSRIKNKSTSRWIIRDSNGTIKMVASKHIGNASIIIAKCTTLRNGMLAVKNNGFLNLEIEGDSKIVINCYNKIIKK